MKAKTFFFVLIIILFIPLYIATNNLIGSEKREIKASSITATISTTSQWTKISFNGANIENYLILNKSEGLKEPIIDQAGIILNKFNGDSVPETIRLELKLGIFDEKVEMLAAKDYIGELSIDIDNIGNYINNKKPFQLPVMIETTSDWTKIELNGATIRKAQILDIKGTTLKEPIIGTKSIILEKLEQNDTSYDSAKFLLDVSLDSPMPLITLEKADNGMTKVTSGELTIENDQRAAKIYKNIPLIIETTSNQTELNFKGLYFRKAKPVEIDKHDLVEEIIGSDFIFLNYTHSGNSYRKASYLVDFGLTDIFTNITIVKNNPGYVIVSLPKYDFVNIGGVGNNTSITYPIYPAYLQSTKIREPIFELDQIKEDKNEQVRDETYMGRVLPLRIETTSDWTEITLKDVTIVSSQINRKVGNTEEPDIGSNSILIKKPASYDNSLAIEEFTLLLNLNEDFIDQHRNNVTMIIAKGDIGSTLVTLGKIENFANAEKIKNDPRNAKTFEIPLNVLQSEKTTKTYTPYNPVIYSLPLYKQLGEQGTQISDTQEMQMAYTINADVFPGRNIFYLEKSDAIRLLSATILLYLILGIILGIRVLSKEGFFDFIHNINMKK